MKYIVAGTGISGIGSAQLLLAHGFDVTVFDENTSRDAAAVSEKILAGHPEWENRLRIALGKLDPADTEGAKACIMSPGIPGKAPFACALREAGIPCISEIELAYRLGKGRIAAITGTNGKTTTTALLGQIVTDAGLDGYTVGNIGNAYTGVVDKLTDESVCVIEVAGFHLETIESFRPNVSAILNITPDHLDRFGTMEAYAAAKERIAENQLADDVCVLNYEDERLREFAAGIRPRVLFFSSARELPEGGFMRGDELVIRLDGSEFVLCTTGDMKLLGRHNHENVLAAALMALSLGIPVGSIRRSIADFNAVEHRIEYVLTRNGVDYYNDSKGTNPDASVQAIRAMNRPAVLIAGGYDKHIEFDEWVKELPGRVRHMVLLGACRQQIADTCDKYGYKDYSFADTFDGAVEAAIREARPGEAVLLSPACASWDMFRSYEVRGRRFKELVREKA